MKLLTTLAALTIVFSGCRDSHSLQNSPPTAASTPVTMAIPPIPDDIGLIMQCTKCTFREEGTERYLAGQVHSDAKQTITGYVLAVDLQDAAGKSVRTIPGLMLLDAMVLHAGETKDFKERVLSTEPNVVQAVVYFKKAGRDIKLSNETALKLTGASTGGTSGKVPSKP
jgi:hypothetical protein